MIEFVKLAQMQISLLSWYSSLDLFQAFLYLIVSFFVCCLQAASIIIFCKVHLSILVTDISELDFDCQLLTTYIEQWAAW